MNHFLQARQVAHDLLAALQTGSDPVGAAITATTAYLLACDRHRMIHHLEDSPDDVAHDILTSDDLIFDQRNAWRAMWRVIDHSRAEGTAPKDHAALAAAWHVWGALMPQAEDSEGMGNL